MSFFIDLLHRHLSANVTVRGSRRVGALFNQIHLYCFNLVHYYQIMFWRFNFFSGWFTVRKIQKSRNQAFRRASGLRPVKTNEKKHSALPGFLKCPCCIKKRRKKYLKNTVIHNSLFNGAAKTRTIVSSKSTRIND